MGYWSYSFKPYVPVAKRKADALRKAGKLAEKDGRKCCPVKIDGRKIAQTFWGKGWCDHLESYSDFENRLPRGRTYVRNGSVVDLQIEPGVVKAIVAGSEVYNVKISIDPLAGPRWRAIKSCCAGQIASMVELLQGRLSKGVMEIIIDRQKGMFPAPDEIKMTCSCPDWATMCKHVAAVMYGIGAHLDQTPELLFTLRKVDHLELIESVGDGGAIAAGSSNDSSRKTLAAEDLSDVFGIDLGGGTDPKPLPPPPVTIAKFARSKSRKTANPTHPPGKAQSIKLQKTVTSPPLRKRRPKKTAPKNPPA
jgi:uncharacterized Zn finger protein